MALAVPLSRLTSLVGGGSAFFVRLRHRRVSVFDDDDLVFGVEFDTLRIADLAALVVGVCDFGYYECFHFMTKLWTVEWSYSQKQYHVDTLERTLARNQKAFTENRSCDYIILAIADSHEEAHKICDGYDKRKPSAA